MKFLFVTEYFPQTPKLDIHGGVEMRNYAISKWLSKKHKVMIITSRQIHMSRFQKIINLEIYRVGIPGTYTRKGNVVNRFIFICCAIWKGIQLEFDIVEGSGYFGWLPAWAIGLIKQKPRSILVADLTSEYAKDAGIWKFPLLLLEKWVLKREWSLVICISKTVAAKVKPFIKPSTNLQIIHCGVFLKRLKEIKQPKYKKATICCVARLAPYKRIQDLIQAVGLMKTEVKCLLVGDGDYKKYLQQLIINNNLQSRVHILGFIPDYDRVMTLMKRSHVFCLPSEVEGFGIATVEALVLGLPAVIADIPVQREITQGLGVLYFKPNDPSDLAQKLDLLFQNKFLYRKLVAQNQNNLYKYDWDYISKQTEATYENLRIN